MSKLPTMPFMVDAYIADTTHLTLEEHGAYLLLLFAMWRRNGSIPDDDGDNARMLRLQPRAWLRLKPRLLPFFQVVGTNLVQKRLQLEWNHAQDNRAKQSDKGKRGAKERWEREQILRSNRGHSTGNASADTPANGTGNDKSNGRQIASILNRDNLTTCTVSASAEEREDIPPALSRLLQTKIMKRTA